MNDMSSKMIDVVAGVLNIPSDVITLDKDLNELTEWDSLAQVMVISELQEVLGISIPIDTPVEIHTIMDLMTLGGVK